MKKEETVDRVGIHELFMHNISSQFGSIIGLHC